MAQPRRGPASVFSAAGGGLLAKAALRRLVERFLFASHRVGTDFASRSRYGSPVGQARVLVRWFVLWRYACTVTFISRRARTPSLLKYRPSPAPSPTTTSTRRSPPSATAQ